MSHASGTVIGKKRVRTLLRVSSRQQLHDDDIPVQRAEAQMYIAQRPEWEFDGEYIEKAVSAYKNGVRDRKVLQQILEDADNREFEVLLAYMSDRIGRQEEYSTYVATLNQMGIEVWTIRDGQLKTEEHVDKLLNYIRFWQNAGESEKTSKRVRDTQRELIRSGKFLGGKAPYGYKLISSGEISNHGRLLKKLMIVEEYADIVRKIYGLAVYQGFGFEKIAKVLNEEGIPPVEAAKWRASTVAGILKNPIYMGYPCIHRRVNHGSFTRLDRRDWVYSEVQVKELVIIQPELWEKAQEIREARKAKFNTSRESAGKQYEEQYNVPFSTKGRLALIGLTYCGYCGKRLKNGSYTNHRVIKSTGEKKVSFTGRYTCPEKCRERSCYSQAYLEDIVCSIVESCMERLEKIDVTEEIEKMYSEQNRNTEKELQKIQKEQKKLQLDIETLEGKIPDAIRGDYCFSAEKLSSIIEEKQQALLELDKTSRAIKHRLSGSRLQCCDMERFIGRVPNWKEEFQNADIQTKQMLLAAIIDKIIVMDGDIHIKFKIWLGDDTDGVALENLLLETIGSPTTPYIPCSK